MSCIVETEARAPMSHTLMAPSVPPVARRVLVRSTASTTTGVEWGFKVRISEASIELSSDERFNANILIDKDREHTIR